MNSGFLNVFSNIILIVFMHLYESDQVSIIVGKLEIRNGKLK